VLFLIGLAVFLADHPRIEVSDGVGPETKRYAAMGEVVILLNGGFNSPTGLESGPTGYRPKSSRKSSTSSANNLVEPSSNAVTSKRERNMRTSDVQTIDKAHSISQRFARAC
jgi:hypothetical protein